MSPKTTTATAGAAQMPLHGRIGRVLLNPLVVFIITFGIRYGLFSFRYAVEPFLAAPVIPHPTVAEFIGSDRATALHYGGESAFVSGTTGERQVTPPPVHFSMWIPMTEAATWREAVFWRERGFADALPYYLQALAPWYVAFIPAVLATPPWTGLVLSAMDGVTAALISQCGSANAALLYAFFVLNPLEALTTAYESLTAFELLLLTLTVQLCARRRTSVVAHAAALLCALTLGSHFIAVPIAVLAPIGTSSKAAAFGAAVAATFGVGAYAIGYLYLTEDSHRSTSLYAPPDNGVMWYVRQLVLPSFGRCLEIFMLQLAPTLLVPMAVAFPTSYVRGRLAGPQSLAKKATAAAAAAVPNVAVEAVSYPRIFPDVRVFFVLMAEGLSLLFRAQITLPYCFLFVLLFYSCMNPAASKTVTLEDKRVVTYSVYQRVRLLVPIFIQLTSVPLQVSFYAGWALRETANANWKFFSDIGFLIGSTAFCAMWYAEVVDDAIACERAMGEVTVDAATPADDAPAATPKTE
ncbi:hypothetical protein ABB37_04976 [Leptomonas pyrrhocoris]|uniref:Uncharacterized protein n=1 Tax=Leptomonas pyrrhocoris TaxID=157538 RepID=A0A0N1J4S8_LEPPY|nr:hypothetical protein ABB37_04976 [Leptomonas pyrrhocoris]KPA79921.1 hypothetical protein ABB37_04976 [Leptomonas pyrrhocoris]|eukprot:XP_015658360.1 hypothetical protein ABB37_04976 [Leptomonas pyrrhocoris]